MTMMTDRKIKAAVASKRLVIEPFFSTKHSKDAKGRRVSSYGCGSCGYDFRLSPSLKIFKDKAALDRYAYSLRELRENGKLVIDPLAFDEDAIFMTPNPVPDEDGRLHFLLPPHTYALGSAMEYLELPPDISCDWLGKSTLARCGLIVNTTPGEPGWRGFVTLEFHNAAGAHLKLYPGQGFCQTRFYDLGESVDEDYAETGGKYQNQGAEPTAAR